MTHSIKKNPRGLCLLVAALLLKQQQSHGFITTAPSHNFHVGDRRFTFHSKSTTRLSMQPPPLSPSSSPSLAEQQQTSSSALYMQQQSETSLQTNNNRQGSSDLSAFSTTADGFGSSSSDFDPSSSTTSTVLLPKADASWQDALLPVLSASLLITGNTVGAGMLVLPELAAAPGMGLSSLVLGGCYLINWISGLTVAQVAIQQQEESGHDVPSSFKEFAEANLPWNGVATGVSMISIFINALVLAFNTSTAGQLGSSFGDAHVMSCVWAALLTIALSTLTIGTLSQVASVLVLGLFGSLAGLLLPGLAAVSEPWAVLTQGSAVGLEVPVLDTVLHMAPVVITTLVFQNIVPTVTRILDYDRTKVFAAITLGSLMPLLIYLAWCVAVLGGGMTDTSSISAMLLTVFSMITVAGSSMGTLLSLSEEFEMMIGNSRTVPDQPKGDVFSLPAVAAPAGLALVLSQVFAEDITHALKLAGSFGSPLLYGLIPVAMAVSQRTKQADEGKKGSSLIPGGVAGLGVLGLGGTGLIGFEMVDNLSAFL